MRCFRPAAAQTTASLPEFTAVTRAFTAGRQRVALYRRPVARTDVASHAAVARASQERLEDCPGIVGDDHSAAAHPLDV